MSHQIAQRTECPEKRLTKSCEDPIQQDSMGGVGHVPTLKDRVFSGSALVRTRADVPAFLEALLLTLRVKPFSDRELFGVRVSLEVAIDAIMATTNQGMRVRYHLGVDGLLLDVEAHELLSLSLSDKSLHLIRHFMTEVSTHDRGVTLYRRLPINS